MKRERERGMTHIRGGWDYFIFLPRGGGWYFISVIREGGIAEGGGRGMYDILF